MKRIPVARPLRLALAATLTLSLVLPAHAGPVRDWVEARRAQRQAMPAEDDSGLAGAVHGQAAAVPAGVRLVHDVAYGRHRAERFDVYLPQAGTRGAPVVFMVHGGGWKHGDKAMQAVVENKVARWVPKGLVFISVNYPMLPEANPLQQADAVARALGAAQRKAASWGGDPGRFVVMGHSAGAHLATLVAATPAIAAAHGVQPWLGTISLDSAAYDVEALMAARHLRLYDEAFGSDPALWRAASPGAQLGTAIAPFLAVCSSRRREACAQAHAFAAQATRLGTRAQVLEQDRSHKEINAELGEPGPYTEAVEAFMGTLDPALYRLLR